MWPTKNHLLFNAALIINKKNIWKILPVFIVTAVHLLHWSGSASGWSETTRSTLLHYRYILTCYCSGYFRKLSSGVAVASKFAVVFYVSSLLSYSSFLPHCPTVFITSLSLIPTVPLSHCPLVHCRLPHYPAAPFSLCATDLLSHCFIVPLFYYPSASLPRSLTVPLLTVPPSVVEPKCFVSAPAPTFKRFRLRSQLRLRH
jgi:hypothetical protein